MPVEQVFFLFFFFTFMKVYNIHIYYTTYKLLCNTTETIPRGAKTMSTPRPLTLMQTTIHKYIKTRKEKTNNAYKIHLWTMSKYLVVKWCIQLGF